LLDNKELTRERCIFLARVDRAKRTRERTEPENGLFPAGLKGKAFSVNTKEERSKDAGLFQQE
jgi:hypothetical protein